MHEARRGWDDKGVHVLDADDGLSIQDLAPSEVKSRVMTYCERCVLCLSPLPPPKLARVYQCGPCCEQIALKTQGSACALTTPSSCALLPKPHKTTPLLTPVRYSAKDPPPFPHLIPARALQHVCTPTTAYGQAHAPNSVAHRANLNQPSTLNPNP